ncbi:hypothetical protein ATHL_01994 [Anaerolinea thermolimosa]|uniref:phage tail tube protein n=1 Tax=Anaerolinea thermolimosa TaxID=229919 RepID=UPI00078021B5|nr:phage tail tube protein [Anaerolinea thermolimosa]GAP07126.1 hypothetical protein ATHL_01994 [Anaerolinea thermolimosa]
MATTNYGVVLSLNSTPIGEVVTIEPPEILNPALESTSHASGGYREFISSNLVEVGEFTATIHYTVASGVYNPLTKLTSGTADNYAISFPNGANWSFNALVTGVKVQEADAQNPDTLKAEITFRPTGTPTLS